MAKQLVVITGKDKGRSFPLPDNGTLSIGRGKDTLTRLIDEQVSRKHCTLEIADGQFKLSDLESKVGTFVNQQRIEQSHVLQTGDVIRIGETELRLEEEDIAEIGTVVGVLPQLQLGGTAVKSASSRSTGGPWAELVGTSLGRFELTGILNRGETSVIFRASDTAEARDVAVKVLLPTATKTDGEMQRIVRQLKPVFGLRHENLIPLHDAGRDRERGCCWFAMDLVDGDSLAQYLQRFGMMGIMNWDQALRIGIHLCKALVVLHKQRIIHRNISPRSIFINNTDKRAQLGGLWAARVHDPSEPEVPTRRDGGTRPDELRDLVYQPREQLQTVPRCDERSDLYSLGATLYSLLTGRPPYDGKNGFELFEQMENATPRRPRELQLSLPPAFEAAVLRLLAKKPQDRYPSAESLLADLERIAEDPTGSLSRFKAPQVPGLPPADDGDELVSIICPNPNCGQRLRARKKCAGAPVRCPGCGGMLVVPGQAPVGQVVVPPQLPTQPMPQTPAPPTAPSPRVPTWQESGSVANDEAAAPPPWPRIIGAAIGVLVVIGAIIWSTGLLGPGKPPAPGPTPPANTPKTP